MDLERAIYRFVTRTNWGAVCYGIAVFLFIACAGSFGSAETYDLWWVWLLGELIAAVFFLALGARESERYHHRETARRNEAFEKRRKREKQLKEIRLAIDENCRKSRADMQMH